jgi:Fe-S cluster biogenesis protein NfuA
VEELELMGTDSTTEAFDVAQPVAVAVAVAAPAPVPAVLTDEERAERMAALDKVMGLMRPAVQQDGGDLVLVDADVVSGVLRLQLEGACGSCAISAATLEGGVERILRARLPWVTEVIGTVDDSIDFTDSAALGRGGYVPRAQP